MEMGLKASFNWEDYELFSKMAKAGVTASEASNKVNQIFRSSYDGTDSMKVELGDGTIDFEVGDLYGDNILVCLEPSEAQRLRHLLGNLIAETGVEF